MMTKFLLKGIIHDKNRSLLPIVIVSIGVMLTVVLHGWLSGVLGESIAMSANFNTGHLKVMTQAYAKDADQLPNDLAILESNRWIETLQKENPEIEWVKRIKFGSLIDFPDSVGETRAQGPVMGWAIDMLSPQSKEITRFNLQQSIVQGRLPQQQSEAIISDDFARRFNVQPGDAFTLFGTTMNGGMAFKNLIVSGTVRFGTTMIDKGAIIADISDIQQAFEMEDGAGEILGFFENNQYNGDQATIVMNNFNTKHTIAEDEYSPTMIRLTDQAGMGEMLNQVNYLGGIMIFVFVLAMSLVLWNSGLLGGLRRYTEFGVRLALGENKNHIYRTLIIEGLMIGVIGSIIGTAIGLGISFYIQNVGINISGMMQSSSLMMPSVLRTSVTPTAFYIGFIPGVFSIVLGNALAGIGIYKRKTSRLFNELEV